MPSVAPGDVIADKYRVERLLGAGGMGYVVAARHITLDQLVAIKLLTKGALGDENDDEAYARFRREAKAVVRLTGEHVARVFDVGVHEPRTGEAEPFIVMEYLEGTDLSGIAKARGAMSVPEAAEFVLQACEALAEPHALGIVHRDIKLANLFLTKSASGAPLLKLLDFGVSKAPSASGAFDVTRTTAMLGSPKYMSPEQMNDPRGVDQRTDVWSLGVVLYRLLAGRAPFEGDTIGRLCTMVLHESPPPLRVVRPDLPATWVGPGASQSIGVDVVVDKCLQKNREHRFANVAELAAALVPFHAQPDAARERAAYVAQVLGVPAPPTGIAAVAALAPPPLVATMDAWASTGTRDAAVGHGSRARVAIGVLAGVLAIACAALAYVVVARVPRTEAAAAAASPPSPPPPPSPSVLESAAPPPPAPASPPLPVVAAATTTEGPAPTASHARSPVVTPPRKPLPPPRKPVSVIPDDRK